MTTRHIRKVRLELFNIFTHFPFPLNFRGSTPRVVVCTKRNYCTDVLIQSYSLNFGIWPNTLDCHSTSTTLFAITTGRKRRRDKKKSPRKRRPYGANSLTLRFLCMPPRNLVLPSIFAGIAGNRLEIVLDFFSQIMSFG